jgi:RHS repeat-associated protein
VAPADGRANGLDAGRGGGRLVGPVWYHYDMLGNVTGELDASGLVQSHIWMEAFGTVLSGGQTGRHLTTKTYAAAGLYDFYARFYSPNLAVFLQRAPINVFDEPPYSYCWQAPTTYVDPDGRIPVLPVLKWANLAIQCGLAAYESYLFADCMDYCIKSYEEIINKPRVPIERKPTDITSLCLNDYGWIALNAGTGILCCITSAVIKAGAPTSGTRVPLGPPPTNRGL